MPDQTPVLNLPYILPAQAQKHVTHNEAIRVLDVIVQLSVAARNLAAPPANPVQGDRFIVAAGAAGDWAGRAGHIALWENGAWQFFAPNVGWTAWVASEQVLAAYSGTAWTSQADGPFNVGQLGISATPDATNRLAVSAPATLLNHAGAGHQLKMNKALATDTASLLFQTGFSGRAEMGTAGGDDFSIKVSADGSAFVTGLSIAAATGAVSLPAALRLGGQASDPPSLSDGMIWLNTTSGEVKLRSGGATVTLATGALGVSNGDKGDITVSAAGAVWTIDAGAVSNGKLAAMPSGTFKARGSAGAGAPEDITAAAAAELLPVVTPSAKGLAPASGGGNTTFLRADGVWAAPSGSGGTLASLGLTATAAQINRITDLPAPPVGAVLMGDPNWNLVLNPTTMTGTNGVVFWSNERTTVVPEAGGVVRLIKTTDVGISNNAVSGWALADNEVWTHSVEMKTTDAAVIPWAAVISRTKFPNLPAIYVNLTTGAFVVTDSGTVIVSQSVVSLPDGWWRVTVTFSAQTGLSQGQLNIIPSSNSGFGALTFAGNGVAALLVRNPQAERGDLRTEGRMVYAQNALVPAGMVAHFAMPSAPVGWLKANGALVSRTTFANLFAAIGATFGAGDGTTTFALPDLRGEFLRGWDDGRNVDSARVFGSAQGHLVGPHGHDLRTGSGTPGQVGGWPIGRASSGVGPAATPRFVGAISSTDMTTAETRPRNVALLACIKF